MRKFILIFLFLLIPFISKSQDTIESLIIQHDITFPDGSIQTTAYPTVITISTNLIFRGEWSSIAIYKTNDYVTYSGNVYYLSPTNLAQIGAAPSTNSNGIAIENQYWSVLISKGNKGDTGPPATMLTQQVVRIVNSSSNYIAWSSNSSDNAQSYWNACFTNATVDTGQTQQIFRTVSSNINFLSWMSNSSNGRISYWIGCLTNGGSGGGVSGDINISVTNTISLSYTNTFINTNLFYITNSIVADINQTNLNTIIVTNDIKIYSTNLVFITNLVQNTINNTNLISITNNNQIIITNIQGNINITNSITNSHPISITNNYSVSNSFTIINSNLVDVGGVSVLDLGETFNFITNINITTNHIVISNIAVSVVTTNINTYNSTNSITLTNIFGAVTVTNLISITNNQGNILITNNINNIITNNIAITNAQGDVIITNIITLTNLITNDISISNHIDVADTFVTNYVYNTITNEISISNHIDAITITNNFAPVNNQTNLTQINFYNPVVGGGTGSTGSITFDGIKIIGAGTNSGDGLGNATMELVPATNLYDIAAAGFAGQGGQYLIIDPTSPGHIHVRAGGPEGQAAAQLLFGGDKANVNVRDQDNSYTEKHHIIINTRSTNNDYYAWTFNDDGNLILPSGGIIKNNDGSTYAGAAGVNETNNVVIEDPANPGNIITQQWIFINGIRTQ